MMAINISGSMQEANIAINNLLESVSCSILEKQQMKQAKPFSVKFSKEYNKFVAQ